MKMLFAVIALICTSLFGLTTAADVCTPGEHYTMPDNPCMDCRCGDDGQPTDCAEMMCDIIQCPAGEWARLIPDTCCGAECVPNLDCSEIACVAGYPSCNEGTTLQIRNDPESCCPVSECVQQVCTPGEYYTMPDNLCKDCLCGSDGQPTEDCREMACSQIYCPPGKTIRYIEGTCCGQECVDPVCTPGQLYNMPHNPCVICECGDDGQPTDMCISPDCWLPTCQDGEVLKRRNGTCCGYYCEQDTQRVCTPEEDYKMPENPCMHCRCGSDGQPTDDCSEMMCDMIECPTGQWAKPIPGTCCGAECVPNLDGKLGYTSIILIVLGAVIIIGSILTLVFCCLYKKKHDITDAGTNQYYDNLKYSHVDAEEKKKVPLDSVYIVKEGYDINEAKLKKEKEALQNA